MATSSKSRLIILLDAENTSKSLEYVRSKCRDANVYIALQTAKYNYLGGSKGDDKSSSISKHRGSSAGVENRVLSGGGKRGSGKKLNAASGPPGSPQTVFTGTSQSFFDSYLNMGKFTLDWIKSNSSTAAGAGLNAAAAAAAAVAAGSFDAGALAGIGLVSDFDPAHSDPYFMSTFQLLLYIFNIGF